MNQATMQPVFWPLGEAIEALLNYFASDKCRVTGSLAEIPVELIQKLNTMFDEWEKTR